MKDRYLYRAKRIDNGEWVEGNIMTCNDRHFIVPKFGISCIEEHKNLMGDNMISLYAFKVEPSTICQRTELKDKNGKPIWENDKCVVKRPCVLAYGTIKYLDGCFCFVEDKTGNILRLCDVRTNRFEIKVESNIFDNPELLEGVEE